jgi:uncharacterized membrane protein
MFTFVRLTVGVALALVAFFVLLFLIKIVFIAAVLAAIAVGGAFLVSLTRRGGRLARARRSDIVQR